jgi:hypothetical protein
VVRLPARPVAGCFGTQKLILYPFARRVVSNVIDKILANEEP